MALQPEQQQQQQQQPQQTSGSASAADTEKRNSWAYLFKRLMTDLRVYSATPRRDVTYWSILGLSAILALASDVFGIMRFFLSLNPEAARQAGFDRIYEVEGLKTFVQPGQYQLRYPGTWLFDQSVAFSQQAAREVPTYRQRRSIIPDAAFGPPGGGIRPATELENLSVVIQPAQPGIGLGQLLGEPRAALQKLAVETLAPQGSGRSIEVVSAEQRNGASAKAQIYEFEYVLTKTTSQGPAVLHTWSSITLGSNKEKPGSQLLYTMTLVAPEASLTPDRKKLFVKSWQSFEPEP